MKNITVQGKKKILRHVLGEGQQEQRLLFSDEGSQSILHVCF